MKKILFLTLLILLTASIVLARPYGEMELLGRTALRLTMTDAEKKLVSTIIADWLDGTADKVTITPNGDGTATITIELTGFDTDDLSEGSGNLYYTTGRVDSWLTAKGAFTGDLLDSTSTKIATVVEGLITAVVFTSVATTDQGLYRHYIHTDGLGAVTY
jgi:hypothetical protein